MLPNKNQHRPIYSRFRKQELQARLRQDIELNHYPRLVVTIIILCSGLSAFLTSYGLLRIGFHDLALRYLLVWIWVYFLFAMGLRIWLALKTSENNQWGNIDVSNTIPDFSPQDSISTDYLGGGGNFGGGGAKGSWEGSSSATSTSLAHDGSTISEGGSLLDGILVGADEGVLPLAVIFAVFAFLVALIGGVAWISYSLIDTAPALLTELLADFLIMNGLGRRLRLASAEKQHWFLTFWQHTRWFFLIITGTILLLFVILHHYHVPAQTLGELLSAHK